jgi:hypothetical protein
MVFLLSLHVSEVDLFFSEAERLFPDKAQLYEIIYKSVLPALRSVSQARRRFTMTLIAPHCCTIAGRPQSSLRFGKRFVTTISAAEAHRSLDLPTSLYQSINVSIL